ncbi:MAG: glycosyltransferase [Planctomycetes bacterium]|nr:glycosyltransferase [Planctomycetota bacterium]
MENYPSVAILIPARHEPSEVMENTILCCYNLSYPSKTIYLLDDSSEEKYKKEAERIAKKYDCQLFRRQQRHGAKAGVINDCMKKLNQKYIAIFDVDQNPI